MGRPIKADKDYWIGKKGCAAIHEMRSKGLTMQKIADAIGISMKTLKNWRETYPSVADAVARGNYDNYKEVVASFKSVLRGYDHQETTEEYKVDKDTGEMILVGKKVVTKHQHPNATALIFAMKNLSDGEYCDRVEQVNIDKPINLVVDDLEKLADDMERNAEK